jgi:MoaA/NifB/PqqE/SkfB family radical SAM enzyme
VQPSRTFCPLPWSALAVQPYGVSLCCASFGDLRQGQETLLETFRGERMRAIREQILNGEWPAECKGCQTAERNGWISRRQDWSQWPIYRDVLEQAGSLDSAPAQLVFLELAGDNRCNLKCRMCRPQYSTKWQEDVPLLRQKAGLLGEWFYEARPSADNLALDPSSDEFRSLRMLMLKGGEPMVNQRYLEFLRGLATAGRAENVTLHMTTNGTVLPPAFLEIAKHFKATQVGMSVDGVDPLFQYIRSGPFTTAHIKRNMEALRNAGIHVRVTTAFQAYNMLGYDRLIEEFRSFTQAFFSNYVATWGLGAGIVPDPLRHQAIERLQRIPRAGLSDWSCRQLDRLEQRLAGARYDPKEWEQFKRYTLELDRIRGESILDAAPEIAAYFNYDPDKPPAPPDRSSNTPMYRECTPLPTHVLGQFDAGRDFRNKAFRSVCYAPFVSLYLDAHGRVRACCHNVTYTLGNVRESRLDAIWKGRQAEALRQALIKYDFQLGCNFCRWQINDRNFRAPSILSFDTHSVVSQNPDWPLQMEFSISNRCNLRCIMCRGDRSSSIRSLREKLPQLKQPYSDQFFIDLRKYLPHLRLARFLGGEPFFTPECFKIWEMMIDDGLSVPCEAITNGTLYNDEVERVLQRLPVSLCISLDGITKGTYESIRVGARFETVMANFQKFLAYTRGQKRRLTIAHCLMVENWQEFGDLLLFAEAHECRVFINTVIQPACNSLYHLPRERLNEILGALQRQGTDLIPRLRENRAVWLNEVSRLQNWMADQRQHMPDL